MTLKEHISLMATLTLNDITYDQVWSAVRDYYCIINENNEDLWFESADEAEQLLQKFLYEQIELTVVDTVQDYEDHIKVGGLHLVACTMSDTNEVYAAALRGEDLSCYGW